MRPELLVVGALLAMTVALFSSTGLHAAGPEQGGPQQERPVSRMNISLGKSSLVNLDAAISRVAVGNPGIADVKIINLRQVYILGVGIGSTNIMLWDKQGQVLAGFDVHVNLNVDQLNDELGKLVPGGKVRVRAVGDSVVLDGEVGDAATAARVLEIVEAFGHKKVVNLMTVAARPAGQVAAPVATEQIEVIRGTDFSTKEFKRVPQQ